jgi:hypothetical protein
LKDVITNHTVSVVISFNGNLDTSYEVNELPTVQLSFYARILFSYFGLDSWSDFCTWIKRANVSLGARKTLEIIRLHQKMKEGFEVKHIFIGVDEIIKIGDLDKISQVLTQLGNIVDDNRIFVSSFVTSLNNVPLHEHTTSSGRVINYCSVPPLMYPENLFQNMDNIKISTNTLYLLIQDCGGHGRTLETLATVIKKYQVSYENPRSMFPNYIYYFRLLLSNVEERTLFPENNFKYLKVALLSKSIDYATKINENLTAIQSLEMGYFKNSIESINDRKFIPILTPVQFFAASKKLNSEYLHFIKAVECMFLQENDVTFTGNPYEMWHFGWEVVIRYALPNQYTLKDIYKKNYKLSKNHPLKHVVFKNHTPAKLKGCWDLLEAYESLRNMKEGVITHFIQKNHQGFDGLHVARTIDQSLVVFNFETKFQSPISDTTVMDKIDKWKNQYIKLLDAITSGKIAEHKNFPSKEDIKEMKNIYLVFVSPDDIKDGWVPSTPQIMLLKGSSLYGASFATRPQFLSRKKVILDCRCGVNRIFGDTVYCDKCHNCEHLKCTNAVLDQRFICYKCTYSSLIYNIQGSMDEESNTSLLSKYLGQYLLAELPKSEIIININTGIITSQMVPFITSINLLDRQ